MEDYSTPFNKIHPLTIVSDKYEGVYSGARYLAFNSCPSKIPIAIGGVGFEEPDFWDNEENYKQYKIGKGETPNAAYYDLLFQIGQ